MNRRERIIELATQIPAVRERLRAMEAEMDSLLPEDEPATTTPAAPTSFDVTIFTPLTERVIRFLEANKGGRYGADDIAKGVALTSDKMTSLRSTLVRLVDEDRIERAEPGVYRAKQKQQHAAA